MLAGIREAIAGYEDVAVDARGKGLLMAIEFCDNATGFEFAKHMLDRGVLVSGTLVNARTIRIEPPLTITEEEADLVSRTVAESVAATDRQKLRSNSEDRAVRKLGPAYIGRAENEMPPVGNEIAFWIVAARRIAAEVQENLFGIRAMAGREFVKGAAKRRAALPGGSVERAIFADDHVA